jgi:adenine-specific DNA-methyltransferase
LGEHCHTLIIPRLAKVIDGADPGGVTGATGWKGGGGFRYFSLAPSLLQQDQSGNWVINKKYNPEQLAQAVCKVEGFVYGPSESVYWQHGHSTERDYIFVTTQTLTRQQIEALAEDVGQQRSLVVYCHAFRVRDVDAFPNLTLKKIPKAVLNKCEWGHDDYSLEIKNLPVPAPESAAAPPTSSLPPPPRRRRDRDNGQQTLFSIGEGAK